MTPLTCLRRSGRRMGCCCRGRGTWRYAGPKAAGPASSHALPPVTVLKPLHGDEPLLEAALASFCAQDYPDFQIVFGVQDGSDPALAIVRDSGAVSRRRHRRRDRRRAARQQPQSQQPYQHVAGRAT